MNISFDIKPHFEFLLMTFCYYIRFMTLGIVNITPKGIDEFNDSSLFCAFITGAIFTISTWITLLSFAFCYFFCAR